MKKRIGSMLMVLMLVALCVMPVCASEFKQEVLESIVYIQEDIVIEGEYIGSWRGTGFFVGRSGKDPQYLVTNYHVIENYVYVGGGQSGSESRLYVAFSQNDYEEAYVVEYNEKMDLAVLRIAKPTSKRKPLKIETSYAVGSQVYAAGFPVLADAAVNSTSSFSMDDASVTSGTINRIITESGTGRRLIQMDASIYGGNSGGPLVNTAGNVIGVNTAGVEGENMNYAVSVEELVPILDRNNIEYDLAGSSQPEPSPDDNDDPIPPVPEPTPKKGVSPAVIIAIAVVAAAAAVVIVIIVMKGKKKPQPAPVPAVQPGQPQRRPMVYSIAPEHGGMKIPVEGRQIQLGRDAASCQIAFREGTPGVSRHHCQISWDSARGEFVLLDLKSSYGTFLTNGQRINSGVPYYIKPGDSFYLGDRANEIRTELS